MWGGTFTEIALILVVAAAVGFLAQLAKQPLIVSYIFVGIALGPAVFNVVSSAEAIELFAQLGIAILLFLVGLKLDVHLIRSIGVVAVVAGLGQVLATTALGFLLAWALGLGIVPALFAAIALTFSSTIIIVKVLSDKRELDQLHGQIAVGILIVQDILVIIAMVAVVAVGSPGQQRTSGQLLVTLGGTAAFLGVVALLALFVLPRLLARLAKSQELTLLFGVGWAISLAATSQLIGITMEIGAFVAGVALASTPYRESLSGRMTSLRDIMILFFFIELGASLTFEGAADQIIPALVLSVFVILGKPLIVLAIMGLMGYRSQVSFKTGMALAQISEFSLIFIALGFSMGQVDQSLLALVTLVGVVTITVSTYFILYSDSLYRALAPLLRVFERDDAEKSGLEERQAHPYDAIVVGAGRLGSSVINGLLDKGARLLVVDHNPEALRAPRERGAETLFGDVSEPEFAGSLPFNEADAVICTAPERGTNLALLETLQRRGFTGNICLTAMDDTTAALLAENPAVSVIRPLHMAASHIVEALPQMRQR